VVRKNILSLGLVVLFLVALLSSGGCIPAGEQEGGFDWSAIVILILIFAAFYFLFIRPQRKRQKEHRELTLELKRGDRVITAGGIYGQIESLSEDSVVLKIESGTTIRIARSSVMGKQEKY